MLHPRGTTGTRFKTNPSRYLARVRARQVALLTERGRAIARLDPVTPADDPEAGVLAALLAERSSTLPERET